MTDWGHVICVLKRHYGSHCREISVRQDMVQSCDGRSNASSARRSRCRRVWALPVNWSWARPSETNGSKIESPLCNLRHFRRKTVNKVAYLPWAISRSDEFNRSRERHGPWGGRTVPLLVPPITLKPLGCSRGLIGSARSAAADAIAGGRAQTSGRHQVPITSYEHKAPPREHARSCLSMQPLTTRNIDSLLTNQGFS
jgi:hypothetical protein